MTRTRALCAAVAGLALAVGLLAPIAKAAPEPGATVATPTISEPPTGIRSHPLWDSYYQLAPFGYQEHEYFVSGTASDGAGNTAPYTTRIIVTRPSHEDDFNGTVLLDWTNVTAQFENAVDTMEARQMLMREGFAYVHVSAQSAGLCCTPLTPKIWDPVRYASLNHPGDQYANDIFSQVAKAFRLPKDAPGNPMGGLEVHHIIAAGQSQSCSKLASYVTTTQNTAQLIDGFLIHGCDATKNTSHDQELHAKVLHLLSDNEANATPAVANDNYRLWEVAGTAHSDYFIGYQSEVGSSGRVVADQPQKTPAEYDEVMRAAGNYGAELHPMLATCVLAGSTMPMHYAVSAAIHQLNLWVQGGPAPDNSPTFNFTAGALAKDAYSNTLGGIRLPPIEVPVATYDSTRCPLGGLTIPFSDVQIQQLYRTFDIYRTKMQAATDFAVGRGWMLPEDAVDMMHRVDVARGRWSLPAQ